MGVKGNGQRVFIVVIVVVFFLTSVATTGLVIYDAVSNKDPQKIATDQSAAQQNQPPQQGGSVQSTDIVAGTGAEAAAGKAVTVNYVGTLINGEKFDSSYDRNQPFTFNLGGGQVIPGWDQGVVGMKVGGKRKLVIPAALAYGEQSPSEKIPANSDLVFEIELLDVK